MAMYTVNQGDCLSSIADRYGLPNWQTIYNHPQNGAFRNLRPDPNVIYPGDELYIPDGNEKTESGTTDQYNNYSVNLYTVRLRVALLDEDHQPMANTAYTLTLGAVPVEGRTDGGGMLERDIPPSLERAELGIRITRDGAETGYTWNLRLGELDPVAENTGMQSRLNNLGYNTGPVDGIVGPRTTDAIRKFQEKYGLPVDGIAGSATRGKLVEVHGC